MLTLYTESSEVISTKFVLVTIRVAAYVGKRLTVMRKAFCGMLLE